MATRIAPEKVAIYIRWSTEDQGQGHTLEIQRESCRYYCLSQGWAVREDLTFIDDGHSGSSLERPALARLRGAVRAGQVDCVVVYKLDRLSRNIKDIINLVLDEWEDQACVRSTQEPVDTTTDAGRMFFTMLGSFADFERSTIKTRTWSGKRKSAEKGKNPGFVYPFGYTKSDDGGWAVVDSEAAVVRRIFQAYIGGRSCMQIADELNKSGHRTRSERLWANADISRLLRNPIYAGRLVYNRKNYGARHKTGQVMEKPADEVIAVDGAVPEIVTPEVWAQAERCREARPRVNRGASARTQSSPYLLSGLMKCPCGHSWVGVKGGKQGERFYVCAGARTKGAAKCASRMVKADWLEAFMVERVRTTWPLKGGFRATLFDALAAEVKDQAARVQELERRLELLAGATERYKHDYKTGKLPVELYLELTQENRAEQDELKRLLRAAQAEQAGAKSRQLDLDAAAHWYDLLDGWEALDLPAQQQVLRMLVEQVDLARPKGAAEIAVHIAWRLPKRG